MSARSFSFRLSTFNTFLFLGGGILLPFLPLWLQNRGIDDHRIGLVVAAMTAVRVLAIPAVTFLADMWGDRRRIVVAASTLSFLFYLLLAVMPSFWPILICAVVAAALFAPVVPLAEVLAITGSAHHNVDYGRIRLWASLSFLAGSLISGALLEVIPMTYVVLLIAAAQGVGALASLLLPPDPGGEKAAPARARPGEILRVLTDRGFIVFVAATGIGQASHGFLYAFGSVHFDHLGYGKLAIGVLWAAGVLTEVTMFGFSSHFFRWFGARRLIVIGVACGLLRWCVIGFEPPFPLLFLAMMLHAGSFGLTHLGTMHFIRENIPANMRNSAQGVHSAMSGGFLLAGFMWASGPLYGALGGQAYFVMAACSAVALGLAVTLLNLSPTTPARADR